MTVHYHAGRGQGIDEKINSYGVGVPLLSTFDLEYYRADGSNADNQIRGVIVQPEVGETKLRIGLYDKSISSQADRFAWRVRSLSLDDPRIVTGRVKSDPNLTYPLPPNFVELDAPQHANEYVFVLVGFMLEAKVNSDFEVYSIAIREGFSQTPGKRSLMLDLKLDSGGGILSVENQGQLSWDIQYAYVPVDLFDVIASSGVNAEAVASFTAPLEPSSLPGSSFADYIVIRGFRLGFVGNQGEPRHHHIRRIGIGQESGNADINLHFYDKNKDDRARFEFDYAIIRRAS